MDDGAIVPLIYEGRFVDQRVDEENIDLWFKQTTKRLTDAQKEDLRKKWSSIRRLTSTDARIKRIALDISEHFVEGYKHTGFKAMLATNYKRDAIRYLECFEKFGDVIAFLKSTGITIDVESIDAMIEAAVYELTNGFIKIEETVEVVNPE